MKGQRLAMLTAVIAVTAGAAFLVERVRDHAKLGAPGVVVVREPIQDEQGHRVGDESVKLPEAVAGYHSKAFPVTTIELGWLPKDTTYGRRLYQRDGAGGATNFLMSVVLMGTDRGSIHKPQICLTGQGWTIDRSEVVEIPIVEPQQYRLAAMRLLASRVLTDQTTGKSVTARAVYVYWFVADGELTPSHGERMWWMARDMILSGVLQRWAYISCQAFCWPGQEEETYGRVKDLIAKAVPRFQRATGARKTVVALSQGTVFR